MIARRLALLSLLALTALAGCSTPPPPKPPVPRMQVVLLPQEDGRPTGVVVQSGNASQTLVEPFQRASSRANQAPVVDQADPEQVRQAYDPLFKIAPPKPVRYVLFFQPGGTRLTGESQAELPRIQAEAARYPGVEILVVGHTDTKGSGDGNDALSLRRAQQVRDLLVQQGLPANHIEAVGRGERELAVATGDEVDEPRNRRVEIQLR
ncbi:OmpA family protein [Curvibacter gracilis]|uniref:OmpA family protein n=1 Tax=Curvibacter gracilis TaxID=230310 RepID=UPI000487954B|nr:OmpA family protein [Curvibacter gracilis]